MAIDFPAGDLVEENMVFVFNRGLLYPVTKWLIKENKSESYSAKIDQPFPDRNTIK